MPGYKTVATAYVNEDRNGNKYLSVTLMEDMKAGAKIFLRKNKYKKTDKQPDYLASVKTEEKMGTEIY